MKKKIVMLLLLVLTLPLFMAMTAGTDADPIVTKSWVDGYIARSFAPLQARVATAEEQLAATDSVIMWIGKKEVQVGSSKKTFDAAPYLTAQGSTMIPLRMLADSIGAQVVWDNPHKKITYLKGADTIVLWIGKKEIKLNGSLKPTTVAPELKNGRSYVPVRVLAENFGYKVLWDNAQKMVRIVIPNTKK